jgi:hypothetical protein
MAIPTDVVREKIEEVDMDTDTDTETGNESPSRGKKKIAGAAIGVATVAAAAGVARKLSRPAPKTTREQLYARAKQLKIPGRSKMRKSQLERALSLKSR